MINESTAPTITPREVIGMMRRHWLGIGIIIASSIGIGYVLVKRARPVYRSSTQIFMDPNASNGRDLVNEVGLTLNKLDTSTQAQIIQSPKTLAEAFFSAGLQMPTDQDAAKGFAIPSVTVQPTASTDILQINVDSSDPQLAQQIALVVPQVYLRYLKQTRQSEVDGAINFLQGSINDQTSALNDAAAKVTEFQNSHPRLQLPDGTAYQGSKIGSYQSSLEDAEAKLAAAQARIGGLIATRNKLPTMQLSPAGVTNPDIEAENAAIATLREKRQTLLLTYFPDAKPVREIDAEIKARQQRIQRLPALKGSLQSSKNPEVLQLDSQIRQAKVEVQAAEAEAEKLRELQRRSEEAYRASGALEPKLKALQDAVVERKARLDEMSRKLEDLRIKRNSVRDPLTVLQEASPAQKIQPHPQQTMTMSIMLGCVLAAVFAFAKDRIDDKLTSPEQALDIVGAQPLGRIPSLPKAGPALAVGEKGGVLENYRLLRFNLLFSTLKDPVKSLVITSTVQGEGKSVLACNLAYAMAVDGKRVILVDADLRAPTIHRKLDLENGPGLIDVLLGRCALDDCLRQMNDNLQVLTAGGTVESPAELLNGAAMRVLHDQLKDRVDCVIIDAPAALAGADAQVLGALADSVLYVAKVGETRRAAIRAGIDMLRHADARILGVVFSNADGRTDHIPYVASEA